MKKLNLLLIACLVAFMGYAQPATDPGVYNPMEDGMFTFENKWLVSPLAPLENMEGAWAFPVGNFARNMVLRDGILYFAHRTGDAHLILRMDAATGDIIDTVDFEGTPIAGITGFHFQDLKLDCAGNLILANMMLSQNTRTQMWVLDMDNPANSHLILDDTVRDIWIDLVGVDDEGNPNVAVPVVRVDFFGFYGNMLEDGIILGANAGAAQHNVLVWHVENGQARWCAETGFINVAVPQPGMIQTLTAFGTAPTAQPISRDLFYLNFASQPPLLMFIDYDELEATVAGSLWADYANEDGLLNMDNFRTPQGIMEFRLRGDYFLLVPYRNWTAPNNLTFRLIRFDDEGRSFADIHPMWEFPLMGLGHVGGAAVGVFGVEVDDRCGEEYGTATIAVYVVGNGFGVYILTSRRPYDECGVSVPGVYGDTMSIFVNGNVVTTPATVATIAVFNVLGQQVLTAVNTNEVTIPASGVFVVRATTLEGQTVTQKVIVR